MWLGAMKAHAEVLKDWGWRDGLGDALAGQQRGCNPAAAPSLAAWSLPSCRQQDAGKVSDLLERFSPPGEMLK